MLKECYTYNLELYGQIIGFFALKKLEGEPVIFIKNFQLKKDFHGKGIGSKALNFIEKVADELGCKSIELSVFKDNPVIDFYKKKEFKESKIKAKNENAILMEKPLKS